MFNREGLKMKSEAGRNFPKCTAAFLKQLEKNNNREWFEAHRHEYEENLLIPAEEFVIEFGAKISKIAPDIIAIPKVDKSIFRLHRDVRFSKNKLPYKTNLGMYFWEGERSKMESPGFYIHVDTKTIFVGSGMYEFTKETLELFRNAVDDPTKGELLDKAVKKVLKKGNYSLGGKKYKKIPRGYDPSSPYAEYLLYNGLYCSFETKDIRDITDSTFQEMCFKICKDLLPLHKWFVELLKV
jgi:uncharacterized protein (TIGR02453 family)